MPRAQLLAAAALVVVLLVVWWRARAAPPPLDGLWTAPAEFLDAAGLSDAHLWLDGERGYLAMSAAEPVANMPLTVRAGAARRSGGDCAFALTLAPAAAGGDARGAAAGIVGAPLQATWRPADGSLLLARDGETLLFLYRDNAASAAALADGAEPRI